MKILIISDAWLPQVNGVVRTYQGLIPALETLNHTVRVIGPDDFKRSMAMPGYAEIKLVVTPHRALSGMIDDFSPDAVHIATEGPLGWAARKYCLSQGLRFTTCYHSKFPEFVEARARKFLPLLGKIANRTVYNMMKHFHAPSSAMLVTTPSMKEHLRKAGFVAPIRFFTRGVDDNIFNIKNDNDTPALLKDIAKPIALYVGRLAVEKNIEAFLSMPWSGSKVVVGHGPDENSLRAMHPDVIFTGKKEGHDLATYYQNADVFIFPSRSDTFGIVLIEALACGLPIAAYDVTGPRDVVTSQALGALDTDLSKAAIIAMNTGEPEACAVHVSRHYSWDIAAQQFINAHKV